MKTRDWVEVISGSKMGYRGFVTLVNEPNQECEVRFLNNHGENEDFQFSTHSFTELKVLIPAPDELFGE